MEVSSQEPFFAASSDCTCAPGGTRDRGIAGCNHQPSCCAGKMSDCRTRSSRASRAATLQSVAGDGSSRSIEEKFRVPEGRHNDGNLLSCAVPNGTRLFPTTYRGLPSPATGCDVPSGLLQSRRGSVWDATLQLRSWGPQAAPLLRWLAGGGRLAARSLLVKLPNPTIYTESEIPL